MIQPKYEIGQSVWAGTSRWGTTRTTCPDCLSSKEWAVTTPSGEQFNIPCNTCEEGYFCTGTIKQWSDIPEATPLTIRTVRIDTGDEHPISYMAMETSNAHGSGTIHNECDLFPTREEAHAHAVTKQTAAQEQRRLNEIAARQKKRSRRKPEWWQRKIKELEKQLAQKAQP